jgi:hypothetical protein
VTLPLCVDEGPAMTAPELDIYDIAFLAGGADRTVETAIVALVLSGRLRVHSPGQLASVDLSRRHPVEAAVLDAVGPTGHRSVDTICWRLVEDDRLLDIGRRLHKAGLLGRLGAAVSVLHGDRRALAPTRAGHRVLRGLGDGPSLGDPEVVRVALGGRKAMTDAKQRAAIFERPVTTLGPNTSRHSRHDIDHSDPHLAAFRGRATGDTSAVTGLEGTYFGSGGL